MDFHAFTRYEVIPEGMLLACFADKRLACLDLAFPPVHKVTQPFLVLLLHKDSQL